MSYTCEHVQPIATRCIECDIKHGYISKELAMELRLLRALEYETRIFVDCSDPSEVYYGVTNMLKAIDVIRRN